MTADTTHALFQEVLDRPNDNTLRLAYADAIEESEPERAAFVRAQIQLAERGEHILNVDHPTAPEAAIVRRVYTDGYLLRWANQAIPGRWQHDRKYWWWLPGLYDYFNPSDGLRRVGDCDFDRGFVTRVSFLVGRVELIPDLLMKCPLDRVFLLHRPIGSPTDGGDATEAEVAIRWMENSTKWTASLRRPVSAVDTEWLLCDSRAELVARILPWLHRRLEVI